MCFFPFYAQHDTVLPQMGEDYSTMLMNKVSEIGREEGTFLSGCSGSVLISGGSVSISGCAVSISTGSVLSLCM